MRALVITCILGSFTGCRGEPSGPRARLVYSIDFGTAIDNRTQEMRRDLERTMAEHTIVATVRMAPDGGLTVTAIDSGSRLGVEQLARSGYADVFAIAPCATSDGPNAICLRISSAYARTVEQTAMHDAVATVRARLGDIEVADPVVVEQGKQIVVEVPAGDLEQLALVEDLIGRVGKLELKVVDAGSQYMRRVAAHVGGSRAGDADPVAIEQGIAVAVDQWRAEDGAAHVDFTLVAHDRVEQVTVEEAHRLGCREKADRGQVHCSVSGRAAIERYLRALSADDPNFQLPDDREIAYEQEATQPGMVDRKPSWRTYLLERTPRLTGKAIVNASASIDPDTNRPIVLIQLDGIGTRELSDLAAQIPGKKLATLLDGKIRSAPIINGAIRGGRASITMGGTDVRRQEADAAELVHVLRAGALPAPLRLETKQIL